MIEGVKVKQLKLIPDDRGRLMEILRKDDDLFAEFGQVYMTTAFPGVVKAWHFHKKQTDNFTCIRGCMRLGLYDSRKTSSTYGKVEEFIISLDSPMLVQIPPEVYHGFKCISEEEAVVINTVTVPYDKNDPDEYRVDAFENDIPFDWNAVIARPAGQSNPKNESTETPSLRGPQGRSNPKNESTETPSLRGPQGRSNPKKRGNLT